MASINIYGLVPSFTSSIRVAAPLSPDVTAAFTSTPFRNVYTDYSSNDFEHKSMPKEEIDKFIEIIENVDVYTNRYESYYAIKYLEETFVNYWLEHISFEELIDQINDNIG